MIRSELRTESRRLLNDTSSIRFADSVLNDWIDLWNIDVISRLELERTTATVALIGSDTFSASEPNYNLGTTFIFLRECYLVDTNSEENRLNIIDQEEMNTRYGETWRTDPVGNPETAYQVDFDVIGLHPRPNLANNGLTLRVFGVADVSDLASDSAVPIMIRAIHTSGPWYVASLGYGLLGDMTRSEYCRGRYEDILSKNRHRAWKFSDDMLQWRF